MTPAVALLGEVEENSLVLRYDILEERLPPALDAINTRYRARLLTPLATSGTLPEFAGVLRDVGVAYRIARDLAEIFHPLAVRVAAARGEVRMVEDTLDEVPEGSAFEVAGELLYRTRKEDRMLLIQGGTPRLDRLGNATFLLLHESMRNWTERQCKVIRLYREVRRQKTVAERLGVSQQSVSASMAAAGWRVLEDAERSIEEVFAEY